MPATQGIVVRNLTRRPGRSVALALIAALLSFTVCAGTMVVASISRGLDALDERLGADIMVVPFSATTKTDFSVENMVLSGATGYFYMDSTAVGKIAATEGVGELSTQFFLASTGSSCCSAKVQIIGYDPATDFTIKPWIATSSTREPGDLEVIVGADLNAFEGDTLRFYGTDVRVVGRLASTGTGLDTAVYTNNETVKRLIRSAYDQSFYEFAFDPDAKVSCVLIDVAEGAVAEEVVNSINTHVRGVQAIQTKGMTSDIADSLSSVATIVRAFVVVIWVLAVVIMAVAFRMIAGERRREFAVLRVVGASRRRLAGIILAEAALVSLAGAVAGVVLGLVASIPFGTLIEQVLTLPYLTPGVGFVSLVAAASIVATVVVGAAASAAQAVRVSQADTSLILRGDA